MTPTPFIKQTSEPLFPKVLWNRPVSRHGAGRLLIIGGHTGNFSVPQGIYQAAVAAGAGECRVVLPDSLTRLVAPTGIGSFVPSSPAGSLGRAAQGEILRWAEDCDAVIIGGSLSNNSETTLLVEALLEKMDRPTVLIDDALEALKFRPELITDDPSRLVILTMQQLFKLAGQKGVGLQIKPEGGLVAKVEVLQTVTEATKANYLVYGPEILVAAEGQISHTPNTPPLEMSAGIYGTAATFWLQNPRKPFEGLTTTAYVLKEGWKEAQRRTEVPTLNDLTSSVSEVIDRDAF